MMQDLEGRNLHDRNFPCGCPYPLGAFPWAPSDFEGDIGRPTSLIDSVVRVTAVAPDQGQARIPLGRFSNDRGATIPFLNRCCLDLDRDREAESVYNYEPFPALDLLARVETAEPPFSVVLTDWLSTAPALASGSRWARSLHRPCRRS